MRHVSAELERGSGEQRLPILALQGQKSGLCLGAQVHGVPLLPLLQGHA